MPFHIKRLGDVSALKSGLNGSAIHFKQEIILSANNLFIKNYLSTVN
jgi:hypothetical protein